MYHFVFFWQVQPNLEEPARIWAVIFYQRKVLAVHYTFASCHPLDVSY